MKEIINLYALTFIKSVILAFLAFIMPIKGLLILTGCAVFADTIFAIYASVKLKGWSSFKSTKLFNIVVKTFFYLGSIIMAFLIDKFVIEKNLLFGVDLLISKVITIFWIYIEIKSIDETSIKIGNKSLYILIKSFMKNAKDLKKDINEFKE